MFKITDNIIYGTTGACVIDDIKTENFKGVSMQYYVIRPIYDKHSVIFAPVGKSENKMRKILSAEQVYELINSIESTDSLWIENEAERKEKFSELIKKGDRAELVALVRTLYLKREEQQKSGKKLHIADQKAMDSAEKLLYEEFAFVLDIELDQVVPFITKQIQINKK
ncbi:MAG: CarD family transcriptional regulator [Clostridia bacterium]|nr:CarD family transcriptional regulator [Clostridia bacterium]